MNFQSGQVVTIKVKNPIWPRRAVYASYVYIPEFYEYTGEVVIDKYTPPGKIKLTTQEPKFTLRTIDIDRIVDTNASEAIIAPTEVKQWTVQGSKDNVYVVTLDHKNYSCNCPGFQFRQNCKHINNIKEKTVNENV